MIATAKLRYQRIAPRKLRVVAKLAKGKPVDQAVSALMYSEKGAAPVLKKLIISAIHNADVKSDGDLDVDRLHVKSITVDQGPPLKRFRPRAMGRASQILKHTSHVQVVLESVE